jgi:membrane peptidoglycan carboxypeptidase
MMSMYKLYRLKIFVVLPILLLGGCFSPKTDYSRLSQELLDHHIQKLESHLAMDGQIRGAVVIISHRTNQILAVNSDHLSRAQDIDQAEIKHQAGPIFKPILFAAALRSGKYTPDSCLSSCPQQDDQDNTLRWQPLNYPEDYSLKSITLQQALQRSMSMPVIQITDTIGTKQVATTAKALGIQSKIDPKISEVAYGAVGLSLLELTLAYRNLADDPRITSMLKNNNAAFKQGSTNGFDAWCIGYGTNQNNVIITPVIGVWLGSSTYLLDSEFRKTAKQIWQSIFEEILYI